MNTNETWTPADEAAFHEMTYRRACVMGLRRAAVVAVVETFDDSESMIGMHSSIVDWLINNADAVRDALRPYDSGVRVAEKPKVDWIAWCGGDMPLPHGTRIEVRHRDGEENVDTAGGAFSKRWDHNGFAGDIVAYRVLP